MSKIGLVLSGGMAKGAYQIGALTALNEFINLNDLSCVSAASIGVLNTYCYLTNKLDRAKELWTTLSVEKDKKFIMSVLRGDFLQQIISKIIVDIQVRIPFYVPLLNVKKRQLNYYNLEGLNSVDIKKYLDASISLPIYTKGVNIDNNILYDGAVVDNIPIHPIINEKDLDYILVIYFDDYHYIFEDEETDKKVIKLTFPDNKIISNSIQVKHSSILHMIDEGYSRTNDILSFIFKDGIENKEIVYENIIDYNLSRKKIQKRITGDVIVTNMNKVIQRVVKKNIDK